MGRDHNDLINIKKQVDIQRTLGLKAMTAERVGVLGGIAVGSLQEFLQYARLGEQPGIPLILMTFWQAMRPQSVSCREDAKKCFEEYGDEATHRLLVDILYNTKRWPEDFVPISSPNQLSAKARKENSG
ncbi:MAG: hypothetical protein WA109_09825 [Bellilinea sp.]